MSDYPSSFDKFRPIVLCNFLYKIVAKLIAMRLKPLLSNFISQEQFGFLNGKLIHESIGSTQEGIIHTITTQKKLVLVVKMNLSKFYDMVSWLITYVFCYFI